MTHYTITPEQASFHGRMRHESTRRMIVEIPASLFHAVNKARRLFSASGYKDSPSLSTAITGLLRAAPQDGEV